MTGIHHSRAEGALLQLEVPNESKKKPSLSAILSLFLSLSSSVYLCSSRLLRERVHAYARTQERVSLPVVSPVKRRTCTTKLIDPQADNVTESPISLEIIHTLLTIGVNVTKQFLRKNRWSSEFYKTPVVIVIEIRLARGTIALVFVCIYMYIWNYEKELCLFDIIVRSYTVNIR